MRMKKLSVLVLAVMLGFTMCMANETADPASTVVSSSAYSSRVSIPTGVFFNGRNFIKVESSWVRICIGGQSAEYSIKNAERDPYGNYALVLEGGLSNTIYPNGRTLYYNGSTYSKK